LIEVGQMTTLINLFQTWPKQCDRGFFLWCAQDAILLAPQHVQWLLGQGTAAAGEATTAGEGGQ